jgi:uncharacterized protein (DUF433 family)
MIIAHSNVERRSDGRLYITGTPFKVRQIALDHICYGWDAAKIQSEHPQLTLGQVYSALGYYYDHQEELDQEIAEGRTLAEKLQADQGESSLIAMARAAGRKLP